MIPRRAERSGHEFVEIVSGNVLDDFAAGASDGAVCEHDRHADDEIAKASVFQAEAAGVVGSSNAADGCAIGPERVEGDELTVLRQRAAAWKTTMQPALNGAGHVLPCVFARRCQGGGYGGSAKGVLGCPSAAWFHFPGARRRRCSWLAYRSTAAISSVFAGAMLKVFSSTRRCSGPLIAARSSAKVCKLVESDIYRRHFLCCD